MPYGTALLLFIIVESSESGRRVIRCYIATIIHSKLSLFNMRGIQLWLKSTDAVTSKGITLKVR